MIFLGPARRFDTVMIFLGIKFKNTDIIMVFVRCPYLLTYYTLLYDTFTSKIAICDIFRYKTLVELIFLGLMENALIVFGGP